MVVEPCPKLDLKLARYAEKIKSIQRYLAPMPILAGYSIIGWDGGKLKEEELRTTREDFELFSRSTAGAVVMEVGSTRLRHGIWSWVWGHEGLVANLRKMEEPTPWVDRVFARTVVPPKHSGS